MSSIKALVQGYSAHRLSRGADGWFESEGAVPPDFHKFVKKGTDKNVACRVDDFTFFLLNWFAKEHGVKRSGVLRDFITLSLMDAIQELDISIDELAEKYIKERKEAE